MNLEDIDLGIWFRKRELEYPPSHFQKVSTKLTEESKKWVISKLRGRYSIVRENDGELGFIQNEMISFEDPKEAMLYELKWS